jgi:anaerobic ribonucleoside-triphosphate reductase activating protein
LDAIDGITFSGGEPMEQAYGLSVVARTARLKKDINIICFSGYRYERLRNNPPNPGVPYLLDQIDVLIDGPYIQEKNDSIGLRGSSNQRVIHLSDRLRTFDLNSQKRRIEVTIESGQLSLIGIPTPEIIHALTETFRLSQKG